jgi:hypothetical protein
MNVMKCLSLIPVSGVSQRLCHDMEAIKQRNKFTLFGCPAAPCLSP